jgi:hypothetical protein
MCTRDASNGKGGSMTDKTKPTYSQPGAVQKVNPKKDDGVVNDSLGTTNIADSTGLDDDKETGDAKARNKNTRED